MATQQRGQRSLTSTRGLASGILAWLEIDFKVNHYLTTVLLLSLFFLGGCEPIYAQATCGCDCPCEYCLPDTRDMEGPVVGVESMPIPTDYWKPCSEIESDLKNCRSWVGCGSAYPIGVEWARKIPATVHWMASFPGKVSEVDPCPAVGYKWTIQVNRCGFVCARSDEEAEGFLEQAH